MFIFLTLIKDGLRNALKNAKTSKLLMSLKSVYAMVFSFVN